MGGRRGRGSGKPSRKQSRASVRREQEPYPTNNTTNSQSQPPLELESTTIKECDEVSDITVESTYSYSENSNISYASAASIASSMAINFRGGVDPPPARGYMGCAVDSDGEDGQMDFQQVKASRKASPRFSPELTKKFKPIELPEIIINKSKPNEPSQRASGGAPPGTSTGNQKHQQLIQQNNIQQNNQQLNSQSRQSKIQPAPQTAHKIRPPTQTQQQPPRQGADRPPSNQGTNRANPKLNTKNFIYKLSNIPRAFCNQKDLYQELRASPFFNILASFKFNFPDNATLHFRETPPKEAIQYFRRRLGEPAVTFSPMTPRTPYPQQPPRIPTYSCVITRVPLNFSEDDVTECLLENGIIAKKLWRITSRATNKITTLVRVVSEDARAIDYMIAKGVHMFMSHFKCEPSNAPAPRPLQCGRCYDFGHAASECREAPICPHCGKTGCRRDCDKQSPPKCTNCNGEHPAYSYKCPQKSAPVQPKQRVAPLLPADKPAPPIPQDSTIKDINNNFVQIDDFLRTLSMTFLNLFPDRRAEVQTVLVAVSRMYLKKEICYNYAGHLVHIAV